MRWLFPPAVVPLAAVAEVMVVGAGVMCFVPFVACTAFAFCFIAVVIHMVHVFVAVIMPHPAQT